MRFLAKSVVTCAAGSLLLLTACGGDNGTARQILGMDRKAPDAFAVSTHAPLAVPQNLDAQLPVPQPGAVRPQEVSAQAAAQSAVFNTQAQPGMGNAVAPSAAEQAILQQAGTADPNVRMEVNREAAQDADVQHGWLDWALFWRDKPQSGVAVDAAAEAERLKRAREAGQSPTSTPTPVIEDSGRLRVRKEIQ